MIFLTSVAFCFILLAVFTKAVAWLIGVALMVLITMLIQICFRCCHTRDTSDLESLINQRELHAARKLENKVLEYDVSIEQLKSDIRVRIKDSKVWTLFDITK